MAPTLRVLLRLLLLGQMSLTVCHDAAHVRDVIFIIFRGVLVPGSSQGSRFFYGRCSRGFSVVLKVRRLGKGEVDLSCPIVSPGPSDFDRPEEVDCSSFSQALSSEAVMLTTSLNSLMRGGALSLGSGVRDGGFTG